MVGARAICLSGQKHERRDEEGVSIDTNHTHSFSGLTSAISSASPSLRSALHAAVLVLAHLQLHLGHRGLASLPRHHRPRRGQSAVRFPVMLRNHWSVTRYL